MSSVALVVLAGAVPAGWLLRAWRAGRARERSVRLLVEPYPNDRASPEALLVTFTALHSLLAGAGHQTLAFEVHLDRRAGGSPLAWFALRCPRGLERHVEAALRVCYPNLRLRILSAALEAPPARVVLRRYSPPRAVATRTVKGPALAHADALLRAMAAAGAPASVQIVLRPASRVVEHLAAATASEEERAAHSPPSALFWAEPRVLASDPARARAIASALRGGGEGPRLIRAWGARSAGPDALSRLSLRRSPRRLYHAAELIGLWQLPSPDFAALPCVRRALPLAPAPPGISRTRSGRGLLRDEHGGVTIAVELRRQHTAVVGAVEQGKSSYLAASAREDLQRPDCAVIVLDPKGDAASAVLSIVPEERTCTLLDMAAPTCGFNPLAAAAAPDAIADQVVGALRALFSEGEVRGSSDRYLRNAIIAALACNARASLWDVARLLEVGPAGTAARTAAADRLIELPEYAEIATFLAEELPAQLADARAATTAKLDAPANKLARVLNSPAVKRILLNDSLRIDLDQVIAGAEVLVVRGALGEIGAGNVTVLMQLLLGMLDAALARVQDRRSAAERRAVALKVDEAPLVINESFAQTLALKRSAGLETVACWQTDAQWPIELREQLDALFAHRVLFATASATDARAASGLLLSEFSDQLRPTDEQTMRLATPDVRLHLPRHTAIVSWTTAAGRERPFIATTLPMALDHARIDGHAARQAERGARRPDDSRRRAEAAAVECRSENDGLASRDSRPRAEAAALQSPAPPTQSPAQAAQLPLEWGAAIAESFAELLEVDGATRRRWLPVAAAKRSPVIDSADRALLEWLAAARCAMTSQIHRRMHPGQALTGTQRQLKRLADAGLLARFQLHRADGGGLPHCCAVTPAAIELLELGGRVAPVLDDAALTDLVSDLHTVGWLLAFEAHSGSAVHEVLGPGRALITAGGRRALAPADLELPSGHRARDFLQGDCAVAAFAPVRPAAVVELVLQDASAARTDLLVVRDRGGDPGWLSPYDHLVSGWWRAVPRYVRLGAPPRVVVLCADAEAAERCVRAADAVLCATLARIGADPLEWQREGRRLIRFVAEGDIHAGSLAALRVPAHPPALRGGAPADPELIELIEPAAVAAKRVAPPPWR